MRLLHPSRVDAAASREVPTRIDRMCEFEAADSLVHRADTLGPVSKPYQRPPSNPVPSGSASRAHLPTVHSLLRVPSHCRPPAPFRARALPTSGSFPLCDITGRVHSRARLPLPHRVPPAGFCNLSAVYSASRLASLFHPAATFRVRLKSRGFSLRAAFLPSSGRAAPMPLSLPIAHRPKPDATFGRPRLRGLSPHGAAFRRAGVNRFHRSLPSSRFCPLQVPRIDVFSGYPKSSTHDVAPRDLRLPVGPT